MYITGMQKGKTMGKLRYQKLSYPENLIWDLGIHIPPEQYAFLEEQIALLSEKPRDVLNSK